MVCLGFWSISFRFFLYICIYVCTPEVGVFQAKILKIPIEMADFVHVIHDLETEIRTPQACRRRYIYIGRITLDSLGDQWLFAGWIWWFVWMKEHSTNIKSEAKRSVCMRGGFSPGVSLCSKGGVDVLLG